MLTTAVRNLRALAIFSLFSATSAIAQLDFSQWFNPGPLSAPHESLEGVKKCSTCHATARGVPDRKCLSCHPEIQERITAQKGFHARQTRDCISCHSEHKGRNYDLMGLDGRTFDHAETGWPLTGAHRTTKCEDCHKESRINVETKKPTNHRTYLGSSAECLSCHKDVHNSQRAEFTDCAKCHTTSSFLKMKARPNFAHNRDTKFALTGKHTQVNCYDCHKQKVWAPLAFERCTSCHVDPHKGSFGSTCQKCHNTNSWKSAAPTGIKGAFDHDKTAFPLRGEHKGVSCVKCHGSQLGKMPDISFAQCSGCHNNPHGNQFQTLWQPKDCTNCHIEDGWQILKFQHNTDSRYALTNRHTQVPCVQCHVDRKYRWLAKTPDCNACHKDVHRGQFMKECAACHTTKGFTPIVFDHNKDARFPLVGKHQFVACNSCHVEGRFKPLDTGCQSCHNDFHKGELGGECTRCHSPIAYNSIEFDHNRESKFKLDGEHLRVPCNQCHKDYRYKLKDFACADCHRDVHKGSFGHACERCHMTSGFNVKSGFHDFGMFSLGGAHDRIDCLECHGPKAPVRISPIECASCHKDPHANSFGRNCWNCHTQVRWLPSTFRHNQTGFELSGAHRFLSCDSCHFNRVFGGLPSECKFCHSKDFNAAIPAHNNAPTTCDSCHFTFGWKPAR